jgi:nucleoid-associated protein YgaU
MKQNNIPELPNLRSEDYENIFNIFTEEDGRYYYNLLQTVAFPQNLPAGYFVDYNIIYGDTWPFISYKVYNNPNLWWIILFANNISNPINSVIPGIKIKVPKIEVVNLILANIRTQK